MEQLDRTAESVQVDCSPKEAGKCALYIDAVKKFIAIDIVPSAVEYVPESLINGRNIIWSGIQ